MTKVKESLRIHYCGQEECVSGHSFGPATRSHYLMHFIIKGMGCYQVGDCTYNVKEGQAFLIRPKELTYYKADRNNPWEYIWIAFDGLEGERLLEDYGLLAHNYLCSFKNNGLWKEYLYKFMESYINSYRNKVHSKDELIGWFYLLFSNISKDKYEPPVSDMNYYKRAERYIGHNYGYSIQINDIAKFVGIDRTYLYKIFRKYNGMSPKKYLTTYRINAAKDMLMNTEYSVTEIALSCGFHDTSMLCKTFLKEIGKSPMQYRCRNM